MADINMSIALDLKNIVALNSLSKNVSQTVKLNSRYVHLLALNDDDSFKDYSGKIATIPKAKVGDNANLVVVNYSEYDSVLSAVLIKYEVVNSRDSVDNIHVVSDSVKRLAIDDTVNMDNNEEFIDVQLYYWTSRIEKLNVTEKYNGLLKIYSGEDFLGYASFEQSIKYTG
ncbi:hypothetical protein [Xenorhabdus koppenhoeferi]|uniref:Inclusion body protein n=1 Tax=Xenorhabdus koppenhoeferi TaxID=351659 RepID=A0A1I7HZE1_9GAMM|nr:hypothetical protein [Xenorhabdus koppenhoeferi]SFU66063.1 hypothetical protein SAMN05421784_11726 [Xenorhabdus koppenhoeferi]